MIRARHDTNRDFDPVLEQFIDKFVIPGVTVKDDDVLVIGIGKTGSGKSMLMLHAYEYYAKNKANINYISFNRTNLADNLSVINNVPKGLRFNGYDEANVSKRDSITKFNKALLDVYYTIRGLNIFHWWNNPSLEMLDKPFIKDRVTGVFLITTTCNDRPRTYYFFLKNRLLDILKKYKNLDYDTLYRVKGKYATWKGWFRDYNGFLKKDYLDKKNPRMVEKVANFRNEFGSDFKSVPADKDSKFASVDDLPDGFTYKPHEVEKLCSYTKQYIGKLRVAGELIEGVHYFNHNKTNNVYTKEGVLFLRQRKIDHGVGGAKWKRTLG